VINLAMRLSRPQAVYMLNCLVGLNRRILRTRSFAPLLTSGVRYRRENGEQWQTIAQLYKAGAGDCEDLSAALAAQYQNRGIPARVALVRTGPNLLHAVVRMPDGTIDDPSRALGM